MNTQSIIKFNQVSKIYNPESSTDTVMAVDDLNLNLNSGEFIAIQGPSGCGKSTLLLMAGTLLHPSQGTIFIGQTDPYQLSPEARSKFRAEAIGFVFQQFHLIPYLTVRENILAAGHTLPESLINEKADALIDELGLRDRVSHTPAELSTGERQRTALARAMLNNPLLILADEPTGNLDEKNTTIVLDQLRQFATAGGAVIMVTHDSQAAAAADRIVRMEHGKITESVPATA